MSSFFSLFLSVHLACCVGGNDGLGFQAPYATSTCINDIFFSIYREVVYFFFDHSCTGILLDVQDVSLVRISFPAAFLIYQPLLNTISFVETDPSFPVYLYVPVRSRRPHLTPNNACISQEQKALHQLNKTYH